jgi:hypothetical protein
MNGAQPRNSDATVVFLQFVVKVAQALTDCQGLPNRLSGVTKQKPEAVRSGVDVSPCDS